jgi:phosphoribosylanthranilate isomerase
VSFQPVPTRFKICGLTRPADAAQAARLGAAYVGVILAGGPRLVSPRQARQVLAGARGEGAPRAVGVFGAQSPAEIAAMAAELGLDVVQLHADPDAAAVRAVRATGCVAEVWAVCRLSAGAPLPPALPALVETADALVVDAHAPGMLGGTGHALDWGAIAPQLAPMRGSRPLVLAGGLRPDNVARAVAEVRPDVVDVSSGVESRPGEKDHAAMHRFAAALAQSIAAV